MRRNAAPRKRLSGCVAAAIWRTALRPSINVSIDVAKAVLLPVTILPPGEVMSMNGQVKRIARNNARKKAQRGGADFRASPVHHVVRERHDRQDAVDLLHDLQTRLQQIVGDVLTLLKEQGYPGATMVELYVPRRLLLLRPFRRTVQMGGWVIGHEVYHVRRPWTDEDTMTIGPNGPVGPVGAAGYAKTAEICLTSDGRIVLPRRDLSSVVIDPFRPRRYKCDPSGNHWKINDALRIARGHLNDFRTRLMRGWQVEELPTTYLEPHQQVTLAAHQPRPRSGR